MPAATRHARERMPLWPNKFRATGRLSLAAAPHSRVQIVDCKVGHPAINEGPPIQKAALLVASTRYDR